MTYEFTMTRRVEFAETDMAGIMHFSNYFRYMEAAEHAMFRSLGLAVHSGAETEGMFGWARVHASCDYMAPARYQDQIEVNVCIAEKGRRSLKFLANMSIAGGGRIARGRWTTVFVRKAAHHDPMRSATMPDDVNELIQAAPPDFLADMERDH